MESGLAVLGLEVGHVGDEGIDGFDGAGVVDAGTAAADIAVTLQADHLEGDGFLDELFFERFAGKAPGDVHGGTEGLDGAPSVVAAGVVDRGVEFVGLGLIDLLHAGGAALGEEPAGDEHQDVDAEGGRGVVEGVFFRVRAVLQHRGHGRRCALNQVLADHDEGQAGGTEVFLRAGIDQAELLDVDGATENVAGHVGDEGGFRVGEGLHLCAGDGFVGGHVDIGGAFGVVQGGIVRHVGGDFLGGVGDDIDGADFLGFLDGLAGPGTGVDIVGHLTCAEKVHGDHGKLEAGTALEEEDLVVIGQAEKLAHVGDGFGVDGVVGFAAVAMLHDGHARAVEIGQFLLGNLENLEGEGGGTCVEVVCSAHE